MDLSKHFLFAVVLLSGFGLAVLFTARINQDSLAWIVGYLKPEGSNYTDVDTGIDYISDAAFIETTGDSKHISLEYPTVDFEKQLWFVRIFPENIRNCAFPFLPHLGACTTRPQNSRLPCASTSDLSFQRHIRHCLRLDLLFLKTPYPHQ
ncbi:hypothetical protein Q3G72_007928 [Acer saccharum]|nr:hypothetical protein Q3G72_007928 [Acer saccharum]